MRVNLPVYVERVKAPGGHRYQTFLLFHEHPFVAHENLNQALSRLGQRVLQQLIAVRRQNRQDDFAAYTFAPAIQDHFIPVEAVVQSRTFRGRLLFAEFPALQGRGAFAPRLPGLWFRTERGRTFEAQAVEQFARHLRYLARKNDLPDPGLLDPELRAWVTAMDLELPDAAPRKKSERSVFAILGSEDKMDGAAELETTGRCLDRGYPDGLEQAALREQERDELARLLDATTPRPLMLVGPTGVGKTTLIKDYVFHTVKKRQRAFAAKRNTWLLSPMRLISGMSYVGQWEERVHVILSEARRRNHLLYFDDFLGLFAGFGSGDLSIAQVLKPVAERGEVRLLAEMSPEQYRVLREVDRGFADLFHVLRIAEPDPPSATRMLLRCGRQLEGLFRCRFDLDVLPTIMDLQHRYAREQALPGKAADFLKRIAAKYRDQEIGRDDVLREFQFQSGFKASFIDRRQRLQRSDVAAALTRRVVGQEPAVEALADAISIAKARLNRTDRPLGVFLFLGPTGVGKTQAAKALAHYWFGAEDRMIRLDMNEFTDSGAAARLTGTFRRPDGLLTSAVRLQPFSVVLLDEIEKADASVHDLLLQVLGEARLTDALGRTVDFSKTVILLTSNLGAQEAAATTGFGRQVPRDDSRAALYRRAAEQFFRPELFNRLDAVIPFRNLERGQITSIAEGLVRELLSREGLTRRHCVLRVDPEAFERMVDWGYHPQLGARALKRTIERELSQPLARKLCDWPMATPAVITIGYSNQPAGLCLEVQPLEPHPALPTNRWPQEPWLPRIEAAASRLDEQLKAINPGTTISVGTITAVQRFYFAARELSHGIWKRIERLRDRGRERRAPVEYARGRKAIVSRFAGVRMPRMVDIPANVSLRELLFSGDLREHLRKLTGSRQEDSPARARQRECSAVLNELALFQYLLTRANAAGTPCRFLLILRALREGATTEVSWLFERYAELFGARLGMRVTRLKQDRSDVSLLLAEDLAAELACFEAGMHVFVSATGLVPVSVTVAELKPDSEPESSWSELETAHRASGHVLRAYDLKHGALDFRTGLACSEPPEAGDLRRLLTMLLPRPDEWEA